MIWRLAHPVRGICAFLLTFSLLGMLFQFGVGLLEMVLMLGCSLGAFAVAAGGRKVSTPSQVPVEP